LKDTANNKVEWIRKEAVGSIFNAGPSEYKELPDLSHCSAVSVQTD
jgi:hypothetical protein